MGIFEGLTTKNPQYEAQLAEQDTMIKELQAQLNKMKKLPVMELDIPKLKDLVVVTFAENKKALMKKGLSKIAEALQSKLIANLSGQILSKQMKELNDVEMLANQIKDTKRVHSQHQQENRKKYPADYDSSSDYEVKKLGDLVKEIEDLKKQIPAESQKQALNLDTLTEQVRRKFEEVRKQAEADMKGQDEKINSFKELVKSVKQSYVDNDKSKQNEIDMINKRHNLVVKEIDQLKKNQDNVVLLNKRIAGVESKAQDMWVMLSKGIGRGQSPELIEALINGIQNDIKELHARDDFIKQKLVKRIEDVKVDMQRGFEINSNHVLELKVNDKLKDTVTSLTHSLADKFETKKSIRLIEKQQKNMFDILTFLLIALGKELPVPSALLQELGKHSILHSTNALANHIQILAQITKNELDSANESLTTKAIWGAQLQSSAQKTQTISTTAPTSSAFGILKSGSTTEADIAVSKPYVSIGKHGVINKRLNQGSIQMNQSMQTITKSSFPNIQKQFGHDSQQSPMVTNINKEEENDSPQMLDPMASGAKATRFLQGLIPQFQYDPMSPGGSNHIQPPPLSARPSTHGFPRRSQHQTHNIKLQMMASLQETPSGQKMTPRASNNLTVFADESVNNLPQLSNRGKAEAIMDERNIIISEIEENQFQSNNDDDSSIGVVQIPQDKTKERSTTNSQSPIALRLGTGAPQSNGLVNKFYSKVLSPQHMDKTARLASQRAPTTSRK